MRIFRLFYTKKEKTFFAGFPLFCIFILFFSLVLSLRMDCLPTG